MEPKQATLNEIIASESDLVHQAAETYGEVFETARDLVLFFGTFIKSIDDPEKFVFVAFHSYAKKHLLLALLSAVRRHHVQANMDLRQVLEAGAWAAYAMAHKDKERFYLPTSDGLIDTPQDLTKPRDTWLTANYPEKSEELKRLKGHINRSTAHASVVLASSAFEMRPADNPGFNAPYFDLPHRNVVLSDIWFAGNVAMGLIHLLYCVNLIEQVFQVVDDFGPRFGDLQRASTRQGAAEKQKYEGKFRQP